MLKESQKRKIRQIAREKSVFEALSYASDLIEGFGVECIWGDAIPENGHSPDVEYVNTGDTYTPTVIYDRVTRRFLWGACWGDIVEQRGY